MQWTLIALVALGAFALLLGFAALVSLTRVRVRSDQAIVISGIGMSVPRVSFASVTVFPVLQHYELIDVSVRRIRLELHGTHRLRCRDKIAVNAVLEVQYRVRPTEEDVLKAAQAYGPSRLQSKDGLEELLAPKLIEGVKSLLRTVDFAFLQRDLERVVEALRNYVGPEFAAIEFMVLALESVVPTPRTELDPENLEDAEALHALAQGLARENSETNELLRRAELERRMKQVEQVEAQLRSAGGGYREQISAARSRVESLQKQLEEAEQLLDSLLGQHLVQK